MSEELAQLQGQIITLEDADGGLLQVGRLNLYRPVHYSVTDTALNQWLFAVSEVGKVDVENGIVTLAF